MEYPLVWFEREVASTNELLSLGVLQYGLNIVIPLCATQGVNLTSRLVSVVF